jgi:hypothetical protein
MHQAVNLFELNVKLRYQKVKGMGCEGTLVILVDWIHVVRDRYQRWVHVNMVINCGVPEKTRYF